MRNICFIIAFFAFATSLWAENTDVYVDRNNPAASDDHAGTDPSNPWMTLNPAKWTNDMTIHVANGTYTVSAKIIIPGTNISIIGESREGVILQSMDDTAFAADATGNTLFQLSGKTASFRSMTIQNVRDNTVKLGGAFDILQNGNLTVTDITFTRLITAQSSWSGGGAIMVRGGTLTADSCIFEACQSNIGGAIMTFTNSSINANEVAISNTRFIDNANPYEAFFTGSHFGGAITFSGKGNFHINQCYFEGNQAKLNTSNSGGGSGGAIMVRLDADATSSLDVRNSVFYQNESDGAGSVLCLGSNGVNTSTVFNLNMTNNAVFQNKGNVYSGSAPNTMALYSAGVQYTGTFIFANNTFFRNYNADRPNSPSISLESMPVAAFFINNLMNDNQVTGTTVYGLICSSVANSAGLRRFKGNIFNHLGGALSVNDPVNYPDLYESNSNATSGNRSWVNNTYQKVYTSLTTPETGMPYLETETGGMGVNFGVDEFVVNNVNVVPDTDIRGRLRTGTTDAGSFEYGTTDITTGIRQPEKETRVIFRYDSGTQTISFDTQQEKVCLFNPNGICCLDQSGISTLNISGLKTGIYILRVTNHGDTNIRKFIKK